MTQVLGSVSPSANTDTDLFTVTGAYGAVISSIYACNTNSSPVAIRVAVIPDGGSLTSENYLYYDIPVPGNDTLAATVGINLELGGKVVVRAASSGVAFNAYGMQ